MGGSAEIVFPANEQYVFYTVTFDEQASYYISVGPDDLNNCSYLMLANAINNNYWYGSSWYLSNVYTPAADTFIFRFDRGYYDNEQEKRYTVSFRKIGEEQVLVPGGNTVTFDQGQYTAMYRIDAVPGSYVLQWPEGAPDNVYIGSSTNYGNTFTLSSNTTYARLSRTNGTEAASYVCQLSDTPYESIELNQTVNMRFSNAEQYRYYQIELETGDYLLSWSGQKASSVYLYRVDKNGRSSVYASDGIYQLTKGVYLRLSRSWIRTGLSPWKKR